MIRNKERKILKIKTERTFRNSDAFLSKSCLADSKQFLDLHRLGSGVVDKCWRGGGGKTVASLFEAGPVLMLLLAVDMLIVVVLVLAAVVVVVVVVVVVAIVGRGGVVLRVERGRQALSSRISDRQQLERVL